MADNVTVSIKVRPLIRREKDSKLTPQWRIRENTIHNVDGTGEPFVFDNIFDETVSTRDLFDRVCRPIVLSALNGINGTIFAYGQTSSGKTYTMMGDENEPGVVPLAAREIFREIELNKDRQFLIRVGYIEIYNEKIFDLLDRSNNANLKVFENSCGDVSVNYKEMITNCPDQVMQHLEEGNKVKRIGDTNMNERSSRSHTIFRITIESREIGRAQDNENDAVQISTLNLVDLAGSERADQTGATGSRLKEGAHINKSLLSLSCVIQKLSENAENQKFINYRDSKLTRILQASLGGNAVTSMICNITPAAFEESYSTLCFANRAKNIKNKPKVNEVLSDAAMMKRLEKEIKRLQEELRSEQSKNSKIKTLELQNAITMRSNQIINSQTHLQFDKSRRRTWCPSTASGIPKPIVYEQDSRLMPPPPPFTKPIDCQTPSTNSEVDDLSPVIRPELLGQNYTKDLLARKVRSTTPSRQFLSVMSVDSAAIPPSFEFNNSDEFVPGELADFGDRSPQSIAREIHTPCALRAAGKRRSRRSSTGDSPANFIDYEKRCKELEQELRELQEFTNLEKNLDLADLKQQLNSREDLQNYQERIDGLEDRCKDLEVELLQKREQVFDVERELIVARKERETAVKEAERCRNLQESIQVEFEVFQSRAKTREKELIESLQEARGDRGGSSGSTASGRSSAGSVDSQLKQLDEARKELKQLEVHNYKLQQQLEECTSELEQLKEAGRDSTDKLEKFRTVLDKDIGRKDSKKLFRAITSLRAILADEDLLLINTSDTDLLIDSLGDSSLNDSEDRSSSPQKVLLTNESGKTSVIYENNNSQIMDISIENGELKKKVKLLEDDFAALHKRYAEERLKLSDQIKELQMQRDDEHGKASSLSKSLKEREAELKKLTAEYDELSTQVMDDIQEMENYKERTVQLEKQLQEKSSEFTQLEQQLKNSIEQLQVLQSSEKEWSERLASLEEECSISKQLEEEFNRELEESKQKCKQAEAKVTPLEERCQELQGTVGQLEKEIEDYTITVQKHSLDIDSLQQEKERFEQLLQEKEESLRKEIEEIAEQRSELEARLSELKISFETLQEEKATLLEENELLQKQLESAREPDQDQLEEIALLKQHIVSLEEERDRLTTEKEQDTNHYRIHTNGETQDKNTNHSEKPLDPSQIEDLRRKCTELEALVSTKEEELKAAKEHSNQLTKIEQELLATKEQKQQSDERADQLSVEMTDLKNEINTLLQTRQQLEHQVTDLKGKIADVEAALTDNEAEKRKLVGKIQTLESEIEESSKFRDQLDQEVQELRSALNTLDQELKENGEKLERFEKQNDEYKQELSEKTETVDQLRLKLDEMEQNAEKRVQDTKAELSEQSEEREALEQQVRKSTEELTTMVSQLEQSTQRVSSLESQISDLKLEMEQTELNRSAAERLKEDVEQELSTVKESLDEAKDDCREKEIEIDDLKKECQRLLQEMSDVKAERDATERTKAVLEEQLAGVRKELQAERERWEQTKNAAGEVETSKQTLLEELDRMREAHELELNTQKEQCNVLQQAKDLLEVKLQELTLKQEVTLQTEQERSEELTELKKSKLELEESIRERESQIQELSQKLEATIKTEQDRSELEQTKIRLEESIRDREAQIQELSKKLEATIKTEQDRSEQLASAVKELEQTKLQLEDNIREQEDQIQKLSEKLEASVKTEQDRSEKLASAVKELEQAKLQLQEAILDREQSLKAEKDRCNELQVRIDELEQKNLSLEVQISALQENHESTLSSEKRELLQAKRAVEEQLRTLQETHKSLQESHTTVVEANQRLDQEKVQLNAELINQRSSLVIVEKKLESVQQQLSEKYLELDDLKRKYSTKATEVEAIKSEKVQISTEMSQKLKEFETCRKELTHLSQNQVPSMQSTIQQLTVQKDELERKLNVSAEELSRRTSELHNLEELVAREKSSNERLAQQLEEAKLSPALQPDGRPSLGDGKVAQALRKENEDLLKQLNELQKMHVFKTKQLQDRIDELKNIEVELGKLKEEMATMRHDSSFQEKETEIVELTQKISHYEQVYEETNTKHRSLQRQNDELRVRHQNLVMEMDDLRRIADKDRKSRRQSTHDDRRGVHFNTRDSASMTDPSSSDCSCLEMDAQIKNLKKQLTIKECQINTQKKLASANPLKNDIVELRNLLKDRERDILQLQEEIRTLSLATADKRCNTCLRQQRMRALRSDKAVGTDLEDASRVQQPDQQTPPDDGQAKKLEEAQEELRKLNDKYQQMKRLCRIRNEKIQDLVGKENESSAANHSVQQEVSQLRWQLKETEDKYSTMQRMYQSKCGAGAAKVERTVQTETKNDELEMLRTKYEKYKSMSIALSEQLMELKRRIPSK